LGAIESRPDGILILYPGEFYILASKNRAGSAVTRRRCAFDPLVGAIRVH